MIISIDVGIVNLGICMYEKGGIIKKWEVITLSKDNVVKSLKKELTKFVTEEEEKQIEVVVIEKQPSRNVKMRTIEGMIEMYFTMRNMKCIKYSAKYKLKSQSNAKSIHGKHNYRERKRLSIEVVKKIVEDPKNTKWKEYYTASKKKDDLADALLQAMSYVNDEIPQVSADNYETKIVARKPTKNQEKKGYSINNVKYFMCNFDIEECKNNHKLSNAVCNYFTTWENAIKILL